MHTIRNIRETIVAVEKQYVLYILCGVCVVLVIQNANCMRRIILLSVACLASTIFFHIL